MLEACNATGFPFDILIFDHTNVAFLLCAFVLIKLLKNKLPEKLRMCSLWLRKKKVAPLLVNHVYLNT